MHGLLTDSSLNGTNVVDGIPRGEGTAPQKHGAKNIAADIAWAFLVGGTT